VSAEISCPRSIQLPVMGEQFTLSDQKLINGGGIERMYQKSAWELMKLNARFSVLPPFFYNTETPTILL